MSSSGGLVGNTGKASSDFNIAGGGGIGKAAAGLIASTVIGGLSDIAVGFVNAGRSKNTYNFNASMMELEKRMYRLSAKQEISNIRRKASTLLSAQRAAIAKSGLAMEGSPIAVMSKGQEEAELDVIFANINMEYGSSLYDTRAGIEKMKGNSVMNDQISASAKTILSTGGEVYKQYQLAKLYGE